ncbi:MAG: glycoside hydrolase family 97 N-terminal domain-containing protein [Muribaculaceae bacterium]|nr:glycoside hydrolase family 97 N-terminal domain-containing protein [Muribaculaceae bacterium]
MIYRKKCSTSVLMVASVLAGVYTARAAKYELASPDGLTIVKVCDEEGVPKYSVSYDGEMLVLPSPLGLAGNLGDYGAGLSVMESDEPVRVTDSYSLPNIKKSHVDYVANRRNLTLGRDGQKMMDVIFEVSDNNVAFRYKILPQGGTRCCVITDEHTGFRFPDGTTTFICPMSKPMEGFARTYPSYETPYVPDDSVGKNGEGFGYTFPALFQI